MGSKAMLIEGLNTKLQLLRLLLDIYLGGLSKTTRQYYTRPKSGLCQCDPNAIVVNQMLIM